MSTGRVLYWMLAGSLIGFGLISLLSIGLPFLLVGVGLIIFGAVRLGGQGFWAAFVGFGGLPALILLWDVSSVAWACQPSSGGPSQPNVSYYTCVDTFVGRLTTYHVLALAFGVIALLGLAWPLLRRTWRR